MHALESTDAYIRTGYRDAVTFVAFPLDRDPLFSHTHCLRAFRPTHTSTSTSLCTTRWIPVCFGGLFNPFVTPFEVSSVNSCFFALYSLCISSSFRDPPAFAAAPTDIITVYNTYSATFSLFRLAYFQWSALLFVPAL